MKYFKGMLIYIGALLIIATIVHVFHGSDFLAGLMGGSLGEKIRRELE